MTKYEELARLAPPIKKPEIQAEYCLTVNAGTVAGKRIQGDALTVACYREGNLLVVWRFCGEDWVGELPDGTIGRKMRLFSPEHIEVTSLNGHYCGYLESKFSAMTHREAELLRGYFHEESKTLRGFNTITTALKARYNRLQEKRLEKEAAETKYWMARVPELPKNAVQEIKRVCHDALFCWVKNEKAIEIMPGGVAERVKCQRLYCDSCDYEWTAPGWEVGHRTKIKCPHCKQEMKAFLTRYGHSHEYQYRSYLLGQSTRDGFWIRRFGVEFNNTGDRAVVTLDERDRWLISKKDNRLYRWINRLHRETNWAFRWEKSNQMDIANGLLVRKGYYETGYSEWGCDFERKLRKALNIQWIDDYISGLSIIGCCGMWNAIRRWPMAESLIKSGWADEIYSIARLGRPYGWGRILNFRSNTYYGFFGLNRQELAAVSKVCGKNSFDAVKKAKDWKAAGLPVTESNLRMVSKIAVYKDVHGLCARFGTTQVMKYLRQQTRRIEGGYDGIISGQAASDWYDYIGMAEAAKADMTLKAVIFPLDLRRRHQEMIQAKKKQTALNRVNSSTTRNTADAVALEKKYKVSKVLKKISGVYRYAEEEYAVVVPEDAEAIIRDSQFLNHCVWRYGSERYFERIGRQESYIFFLRRQSDLETPYYTLEVEPGGTIRQCRSYDNEQYPDMEDFKPFLTRWQQTVAQRMDADEKRLSGTAKVLRLQEFEALRQSGTMVRTGSQHGMLLADALIASLMEAEPLAA